MYINDDTVTINTLCRQYYSSAHPRGRHHDHSRLFRFNKHNEIIFNKYIYIIIFFRAPPTAPGWWFHQRNRKTSQASTNIVRMNTQKDCFICIIIILPTYYTNAPAGARAANGGGGRIRCFL